VRRLVVGADEQVFRDVGAEPVPDTKGRRAPGGRTVGVSVTTGLPSRAMITSSPASAQATSSASFALAAAILMVTAMP
jgi:hypothetical protein